MLSIYQNRNRKGLSMYQMGVTVVMETIDASHKAEIFNKLSESGYEFFENTVSK